MIASAVLLAVAALYYAAASRIPISALADDFGPQGLPVALAILLAAVAVAIGVRAGFAQRAAEQAAGGEEKERAAPPLRAFGLLALGAAYIPIAWLLGYVPAILLVLAAIAFYEGTRPSWRMGAVVLGGAAFFWLLFAVILGVPQPQGILFQ